MHYQEEIVFLCITQTKYLLKKIYLIKLIANPVQARPEVLQWAEREQRTTDLGAQLHGYAGL